MNGLKEWSASVKVFSWLSVDGPF
jgi:superfamily II RNA helicase